MSATDQFAVGKLFQQLDQDLAIFKPNCVEPATVDQHGWVVHEDQSVKVLRAAEGTASPGELCRTDSPRNFTRDVGIQADELPASQTVLKGETTIDQLTAVGKDLCDRLAVVVVSGDQKKSFGEVAERLAKRDVGFFDFIVSRVAGHDQAVKIGEAISDLIKDSLKPRPGGNAAQFPPVREQVAVGDLKNAV